MRSARRFGGLVAAAVLLSGCQTFLPYADDRHLPTPVTVADASSERAALNERVYDPANRRVIDPLIQRRTL